MARDDLRSYELFKGLSDEGLGLLELRATEIECPAGQAILLHDAPAAGMYVILEGGVTVDLPGRTVEVGPGEFVGELALLVPGSRRIARVRAMGDTRCLSISRDVFEELLETEPSFTLALLRGVARRLVEAR